MKQEISIHLVSKQSSGKQQEKIEKDLLGTYFLKEGVRYFLYEDRPGLRITIKVKEHSLTLIQSGENSWNHIFLPGQTSTSRYSTPYGDFFLELTTKKIGFRETQEGWEIELVYYFFAGDEESTQIDLNLVVKRGDQNDNSRR